MIIDIQKFDFYGGPFYISEALQVPGQGESWYIVSRYTYEASVQRDRTITQGLAKDTGNKSFGGLNQKDEDTLL